MPALPEPMVTSVFECRRGANGDVLLIGRLDAAQAATAETLFEELETGVAVDLSALDYISSAGLGVLLKTHKRLAAEGSGLKLVEVNAHIQDILHYSGFDMLFEVIPASPAG